MWDLKLFPQQEPETLGHSPVSENSLDRNIACVIDHDVGQDLLNLWTNGQGNLS